VDADEDGYEEVICTGMSPRKPASGYRLVLYVPRTRETYTLRLLSDEGHGGPKVLRAIWSANSLTRKGSPYRAALQRRARSLIGTM
jgi:hypothetical protein